MSYPGYPGYPQAPGQQSNQQVPPAYQATAPLTYPIYPGTSAPHQYPYTSAPYGQPTQYNPSPHPYPQSVYPEQPAPYPAGPAPYPSQPLYPGTYPQPQPGFPPQPQPGLPPQLQPGLPPQSQSGLPPQPQPSYPSQYPSKPSQEPSHPTGSAAYPGGNSGSSYGSHAPYPGAVPVYPSSTLGAQSVQNPQQFCNKGQPTLRPAHPFDPRSDAEILRKAMKGFGTDEKAIIQILTKRTNNQRQEIALQFKTMYGKDLIADLKSETNGKFEDVLVAMMTPIPEFLAHELHHAMSGVGTNEETLVEILCTATNSDIRYIRSAYEKLYHNSLENDLSSDTSGNFRRLLVSLCQGGRSENYMVDIAAAMNDAQTLLRAGEIRLGTDESAFNAILCSRSYPQLAQVFIEYQKLSGHDFEKAVKNEFSGDIEKGLLAIVRSVRDKCGFFADQLHESMSGMGTKDRALIRVITTRCEVDMMDIKRSFMAKYGKTLEDFISGDTSGDYKKTLLALVS